MRVLKIVYAVAISISVAMLPSCSAESPTEPSAVTSSTETSPGGITAPSVSVRSGEYTVNGIGKYARRFDVASESQVTVTVESTDNEHRIRAGILLGECTLTLTSDTCSLSDSIAEIMGSVLGWNPETLEREVEHYEARVQAERESQRQPDDRTADAARMGAPDVRTGSALRSPSPQGIARD